MSAAIADTGLADFGLDDFVEPLERLLDSVHTEGDLTAMGVQALEGEASRLLANRLRIQAAINEHPEILDEEVSDPIVITGLARTGSTKLHRVIAADPGMQSLPLWRALHPAPLAPAGEPDTRIALADEMSELTAQYFPDVMTAHPMRTHEPEEEVLLLQLSFRTFANAWFFRAPSYLKWLMAADPTPAFHDLKRSLQYLQWSDGGRRGRPWVLKSPVHLGSLDVVFQEFPAATVVHCHRDPREAVPSLARLVEVFRLSRGIGHVDCAELGTFLNGFCAQLWQTNVEQRAKLDESRILDMRYEAIRDDILPLVQAIYASRGTPLEDAAAKAMVAWEQENPQHRFGRHTYTLEQFGLSEDSVDQAFAGYRDHFSARA
jgi:hypothetical protein